MGTRAAKADLKTRRTTASVTDFLDAISDDARRRDCLTVVDLMTRATGTDPEMWGASIVGFGSYHYKYATGREGDWFVMGFSPRKQDLTLYLMAGFQRYPALMQKLGKYKTGESCLYIKRLADVDLAVLQELIEESAKHPAPAQTHADRGATSQRASRVSRRAR